MFLEQKGMLLHCWWECELAPTRRITVRRFHRKTKNSRHNDPATPVPGAHPEKPAMWKDTRAPTFTAALFTKAKTWKRPGCPPTDEWIQMWHTYVMD